MNFNEKLTSFFEKVSLNTPKTPKYLEHRYCDFIELVTLFSNENYVTKDNILNRIRGDGEELLSEEDQKELDHIDSFSDIGDTTTNKEDIQESNIAKLFETIKDRCEQFKESYPFAFHKQFKALKLKSTLSISNKLYISLLLSSQLSNFSTFQHCLTSEFEKISSEALKAYLPKTAVIKEFGKQSEYKGSVQEKIKQLAMDTKIDINDYELSNIPASSNQDKGLDIIGWVPFGDEIPNMLIFLGQCACGTNYSKKQQDTRSFAEYFRFYKQKPIHSLFVPHSYSNSDLKFSHSDSFSSDVIVFERNRILNLIDDPRFFERLYTFQIVNKCIDYEEELI